MDWAKAKTILIAVLIGVNATLAGVLAFRHNEAESSKIRELAEIAAVLELAGYELPPEPLPDDSAPVLDLLRDADAERAAAEFLLGGPAASLPLSTGGASMRYICRLGEAVFRTGGNFDLDFYEPLYTDDIQTTLPDWLRGMGFLTGDSQADIAAADSGAAVHARRGGLLSWDEGATALVFDGKAVSISGRWQLGQIRRSPSIGISNPAHWALLSLAEYLRVSAGGPPGRLLDMELGYSLEVLSSDITRFIPCWRVNLETGSYYVNALTGDVK